MGVPSRILQNENVNLIFKAYKCWRDGRAIRCSRYLVSVFATNPSRSHEIGEFLLFHGKIFYQSKKQKIYEQSNDK